MNDNQTAKLELPLLLAAAANARAMSEQSVSMFSLTCVQKDWQSAELHRINALASMEACLDHIAELHRRIGQS